MDFGDNICVGDVGWGYNNAWRQVLIGCKKATTPYVFMVESDCLYPKGYFDFVPTDLTTIYTYTNVWIMRLKNENDAFYQKEQTHGSLLYPRELAIEFFEKLLEGLPMWKAARFGSSPKGKPAVRREDYGFTEFTSEFPVINIITRANGRKGTATIKTVKPRSELPYRGDRDELKEWLLC